MMLVPPHTHAHTHSAGVKPVVPPACPPPRVWRGAHMDGRNPLAMCRHSSPALCSHYISEESCPPLPTQRWRGCSSRILCRCLCDLSMPLPVVALPCGSRSIKSTRFPWAAIPAPRFIAVVVFATPPFWFAMATIRLTSFTFSIF